MATLKRERPQDTMTPQDNRYLIETYLAGAFEPPKTAVDRIYDDLYRRIVSLDLPPGSELTRVALCEEYSVSQTPVREALQRLERVNLVEVKPQSGTKVAFINVEEVKQNHFLRESLEFEVVRTLAEQTIDGLIPRLRTLVTMQGQLEGYDQDTMNLFSRLDEVFHRTLFEAAGQGRLHHLVRSMSGHMDRIRRLHLPTEGKVRSVISSHTDIIDAIEANTPDLAVSHMRSHLKGTLAQLDNIRAAHPQYFV